MTRSEKQVKLARLKLGQGVPTRTFGGGIFFHHPIHDESGVQVGHVKVEPRNDGQHLHVDWIGTGKTAAESEPNVLGPEAMRTSLASLAAHYPKAEFVSGLRISGFRGRDNAERVVVPLDRFRRPEKQAAGSKPTVNTPIAPVVGTRPVPALPKIHYVNGGQYLDRPGKPLVKLAKRGKPKLKDEPWTTPSEHDQVLRAAAAGHSRREYTPMLGLADKLDEIGRPGGNLLRHSYAAKVQHGAAAYPQLAYEAYTGEPNERPAISPDKKLEVRASYTPTDFAHEQFRPVLEVTHLPDDENAEHFGTYLHHNIIVRSKAHFRDLLADLPASVQKQMIAQMQRVTRHPGVDLPDTHELDGPVKLARMPGRVDSVGSANASAGSVNHQKRLDVVRQVMKEAGLSPSVVRAAIAHEGKGSTPGFTGVVQRAVHPEHLQYTAAWLGLMTGQKRLAAVQPDPEGEDFLHVISAPGTPYHIAEALKRAGVDKFTTEQTPAGSRAFVLNPMGKYPIEQAVKGIPNASHSFGRVRVYRLGAGASTNADSGKPSSTAADARAGYRSVIDSFERQAGSGEGA